VFLITAGAILGFGSAGLVYASYQRFLNGTNAGTTPVVSQPKTNPTIARTTKVPTQKAQATPTTKKQPTPATMNALPTTANVTFTFQGHNATVRTVGWSSGMMLASGSDDASVQIWDMQGNVQQVLRQGAPVLTLAWSPEGKRLVTGAANQVTFFNAQTGTILAQNGRAHALAVNSVAWTGVGMSQIVSAGADKRAVVWDNVMYKPQEMYVKHTVPILAAAWAPNGQDVATSSEGGLVRVWSAANAQDVHGYFTDAALPMPTVAFAPTGTLLAVGGSDGVVRLWNGLMCVNNGARCNDAPQRLQVSQKAVRTLGWSPDGRMLAVGTDDGLLSVFALGQQQQKLFTLQQKAAVSSLVWSPDSKQLGVAVGNAVLLMTLM
jgi:WD40 repeat protein